MMDAMTTAYTGPRYHQPSPAQHAVGLWVAGSGGQAKHRDQRCDDRRLPGYGAVLVERGGGWFESPPTGRVPVSSPTLLWLFPGIAHSYAPDPEWDERWVLFAGPLAERLRAAGALVPAAAVHACPRDGRCHQAFDRCWQAAGTEGGPLAPALAAAALHELIVAAQAVQQGYAEGATPRDRLVADAIALIEAPGGDRRSPEAIAAELAVPYSTLRRRFRAVTGGSLRDHAIGLRLNRARRLLVASDDSVAAIARRCGFDDPYYFSRLFTRRVGLSPSAFRRSGFL